MSFLNQPCIATDTTWQEDRTAGKKAFDAGNYKDALVHFESALKKVEATSTSSETNDTASCCAWLAEAYRAQGRYTKAEPLLKRALAFEKKALGPVHPHVATSINNLALLYRSQGRYTEAEPLLKRAQAIFEKAYGPNSRLVATSLNNLALLYCGEGRYPDAEPLYKRALAVSEKTYGPVHPFVATCLNNLAGLYEKRGRYSEAEPLYKRALAVSEKACGPDHPDVATSLNNLAGLYEKQGRYPESEPLYKQSLVLLNKALGPDHPFVATCLDNLAGLYKKQGRYSESEPLFKRALAVSEKIYGPDHPDVATSINNLAGLYEKQGRYPEVEPLYKRALAVFEKACGPDHPNVASSLNNLGEFLDTVGRYPEAEPLLQRARVLYEKAYGPDHPLVAAPLNNLALLYCGEGRYPEAEHLFRRALAIRKKVLGPDHPDVTTSLCNLAGLYDLQGRYPEAEPLIKQALAIREKVLGPDHPDVASSLSTLANHYLTQGRYRKAESPFKRALAILEKAYGPAHPDVATYLRNLAALYEKQGRYPEAELQYKRALLIKERSLDAQARDPRPFARAVQKQRFRIIDFLTTVTRDCRVHRKASLADSNLLELEILKKLQSMPSTAVMKDFDKVLESRRRLAGENDPQTAETLIQIGVAFEAIDGNSDRLGRKAFKPLCSFAMDLLDDTTSSAEEVPSLSKSKSKTVQRLGGKEQAKTFAAITLLTLGNLLAGNSVDEKAKHCFLLSERCSLALTNQDEYDRVNSLLSLSESWLNLGEYSKSQDLLSKAASFANHPANRLICKLADSRLQLTQADYSSAFEKGQEALKFANEMLSSNDTKFSEELLFECYKILAEASSALGRIDDAKEFANSALSLKKLGKSEQAYGKVLLGTIQFELKQYEDAVRTLQSATDLHDSNDKTLNEDTFTQAAAMLGFTLERLGDLKSDLGARRWLGYALSWDKNNPSANGLLATARDYNGLALVETALVAAKDKDGDADRAKYYALEGSQKIDKFIKTAFPGLSIGQQCAFLAVAKQQRDALLTACQNKESIGPAYGLMMRWKGLLLESLRTKGAIKVAVQNDPQLKKKQELLETKIRLLAALANKGDDTIGGEELKNRYRLETAERERLERELSAASGVRMKDPLSDIGTDTFRALLKPDEAFVDIVLYKPLTQDNERYAAIVMKAGPEGEPEFFDLGTREEIDKTVHRWRHGVINAQQVAQSNLNHDRVVPDSSVKKLAKDLPNQNENPNDPDYPATKFPFNMAYLIGAVMALAVLTLLRDSTTGNCFKRSQFPCSLVLGSIMLSMCIASCSNHEPGREVGSFPDQDQGEQISAKEFAQLTARLSDLILTNSKVQVFLGNGIKRIWLCPEGEFSRVPWNAIAAINGSSTTNQMVSEVDSPREFMFLRTDDDKHAAKSRKILLAGLSHFEKAGLNRIEGAIKEVSQLKELADSLHRSVDYLPEENATKDSVRKKLTEVTDAHIATHGFSRTDSTEDGANRGTRAPRFTMRTGGGSITLASARNPLSDCGIYLAYPKDAISNNEELAPNILTADEIIGLDLSKCDIVTLSACQTGLGHTLNGQGIIGLRSSIIGAGAKSVLMSLWSVPDEATQELMKRFYRNLWDKNMSKQAALADAQSFVRSKGWKGPKNWAAWVLVGE